MNRPTLVRELKALGVSFSGWMPVLLCDKCKRRWEPFHETVDSFAATARFDYWKCPNGCNAAALASRDVQTAIPRYLVIDGIPGMIFDDDDLSEFERYVRSLDATEVPDRRNNVT